MLRALLCLSLLLVVFPVRADEDGHERAKRALEAGEIVPLDQILDVLRDRGLNRVLEVELERHGDRWTYEVETISPQGVIDKYAVDAATKEILPYPAPDESDED